MPMTGAQRIEKYRQRQKARVAELERDLAECRQERAQRLRQVFDLDEQVTNLQKSNKRVWTMYKPESTEGGRRVSVLRRQEGAPVLLG